MIDQFFTTEPPENPQHFLREAFSKALGQARGFFWKPFTALYTLIPDTQSMCK